TILTWSPSMTNTTSTCLGASFDFLSLLKRFVSDDELVAAREFVLTELVPVAREFVFAVFIGLIFGNRAVTLAMGTVSAFVRERVPISAVTDMPGRKSSFSLMRIWSSNFVASPPALLLLLSAFAAVWPKPFAEFATSVTVPLNFLSLKASTSSRAFWPGSI